MAKRLLDQENIPYEEISLEGNNELRQKLAEENNGFRTVPMIFAGDLFLGGFQEISDLHKQNKLLALAKKNS